MRFKMAYISAEDTKAIRKALKTALPQFKFSVRNSNHTGVTVTIVSGPTDFGCGSHAQLNEFYPDKYENADTFKKIIKITNTAGSRPNYDNSDAMIDYFDVGYYTNFQVGTWEKPFVKTA